MSEGYHKFANFMVDKKYPIFRRFAAVAARDLLYRQAELAALDDEYMKLCARNKNAEGEQSLYDGNWEILSTSASRSKGEEQWQKALEIRGKLADYYSCVSQYGDIEREPQPRKRDVEMMLDWVRRPDLGGGLLFTGPDLCPLEKSVYRDGVSDDLMILRPRLGENDAFTRLLSGPLFHGIEKVIRCFKNPVSSVDLEKQEPPSNLLEYSDATIMGIIDSMGTIVASMSPLLPIIILYFVQNHGSRLAVVCIFTLLFSVTLAIVTKARRVEIFAATAAFASVQVVFLGTTNEIPT
ncbi:hypothetical protein HYFRA_00007708 [Hymenoscyphus fraxineus]|uniref:DUF6594 domain-containing protein n=1 Tax=Hymenoscyphus fraxineus TaxID=746836 RepID=A0A9N9PN83_9HELO|nr:hypothetical protein HYFRA_00007708 [Hymenoscyphus fraxineus]